MNPYDELSFFTEYGKMDRSRSGLSAAGEWPQFERLFTGISGADILDLGCGYGWHARYAAERGARSVLGIDGSEKMLQKAEESTPDERIRYLHANIEEYEPPEEAFDIVISNLSLHYVEDLGPVYEKIRRTLRQDGYVLINIEHPVFTAGVDQNFVRDEQGNALYWPVDDYFIEGKRETDFLGMRIIKYHHTLTTVLNGLLRSGFIPEAVEEVRPEQKVIEENGWHDELKRPMMLLVKARKNT